MASEKNLLILTFLYCMTVGHVNANTVCTTYEGTRLCGNSLSVRSDAEEFKNCYQNDPRKCKNLVITNSHLASGTIVELCDTEMKCSVIPQSSILNDIVNDVAIFEVESLKKSDLAGTIVKNPSGAAGFYLYHRVGEDSKYKDLFSDKVLDLKFSGNNRGIVSTNWMENDLRGQGTDVSWEGDAVGFVDFIVSPGMSGSPVFELILDTEHGTINEIKGLVTSYHNFLPVSSYAKKTELVNVGRDYLKGRRGLTSESEQLSAKWHYSVEAKSTFRSLHEGRLWETGVLKLPTGGAVATDSGGAVATDSGGAVATDSGGAVVTDSGTVPCYPVEGQSDSSLIAKIIEHYSLFPGVIINDKRVIGFRDISSNRIIYANWELLVSDDISSFKNDRFRPLLDEDFDGLELLKANHPDLVKLGTQTFCLAGDSDCVVMTIEGDTQLSISSSNSDKKTFFDLEALRSTDIFKNVPVEFAQGRASSIWLADIFLPDMNLDNIRDSRASLIGGDHATGKVEVFNLIKDKSLRTTN